MSPKIDVVYPLGSGSKWDNGELRYSLRSLEKNFRDLGRVFICGVLPDWITNVICLPVPDKHHSNKDANIIDKVLQACEAGVSKKFIRLSDDQCILQPVSVTDMKKLCGDDLANKKETYWNGGWKQRLRRTVQYLAKHKHSTYFYDTHCPQVYERKSFVRVMKRCDYQHPPGYCINTLYFNQLKIKKRHHMNGRKLTLEKPAPNAEDIRQRLQGKLYLGYNDAGLTEDLKAVLQGLFPKPSRFEIP